MQIFPLGSRLVAALPIPIGKEWYNFSTDLKSSTNSSILLQRKQAPSPHQVHITQAKPQAKYCT
jgi:hypothetical protein